MKKGKILIILLLLVPVLSFAQLKKDTTLPSFSNLLVQPRTDFLFGFLDPNKMHMNHMVSMSYSGFSGQGMMLSSYTNTISYQFSDKLLLTTNLGILTSPYNTFGESFYLNQPKLFGGAMLEYKMSEESSVMLQFQITPYQYMYQPMWGSPYLGQYRFNNF